MDSSTLEAPSLLFCIVLLIWRLPGVSLATLWDSSTLGTSHCVFNYVSIGGGISGGKPGNLRDSSTPEALPLAVFLLRSLGVSLETLRTAAPQGSRFFLFFFTTSINIYSENNSLFPFSEINKLNELTIQQDQLSQRRSSTTNSQ